MMTLLAAASVPPLFALLAVMLLAVVAVSLLFLRVRQSLLVAYFICGIIIANSGSWSRSPPGRQSPSGTWRSSASSCSSSRSVWSFH
jgi:Kef-type K+ transport system membrane component KefB